MFKKEVQKTGKILILRFDTMGDMVLFSGVTEALLKIYPDAEITIMVLEKMRHVSGIFNPALKWWVISEQIFHSELWRIYTGDLEYELLQDIVVEIKKRSFDLLVSPLHLNTFLGSYLSRASSVDRRIGFPSTDRFQLDKVPEQFRQGLSSATFTEEVAADEWCHELEKNRLLLTRLLGTDTSLPEPRVYLSQQAVSWVESYLRENGFGEGQRFAVIFPGAGHHFRSWSVSGFAEIADWLCSEKKLVPIITGSRFDTEMIEQVVRIYFERTGKRAISPVFEPDELDRFAALLSKASLYVGNDTGAMHIAASLDIPVVGIFGGGTWGRFFPYGSRCVVVAHRLPCYQCHWHCIEHNHLCMRVIAVESVKNGVKFVLDGSARFVRGEPCIIKNEEIEGMKEMVAKHFATLERNQRINAILKGGLFRMVMNVLRAIKNFLVGDPASQDSHDVSAPQELKDCDFCGSKEFTSVFPKVVRCNKCGYVLTNPQLSVIELEKYYSTDYMQASVQTPASAADIHKPPFDASLNRSRELGFVTHHKSSGRLLDIGCAWGGLLYLAREQGFETYGVEISRPNVAFARQQLGIDVHAGQLWEAKFADAFFDAIIAVHMLEHSPDPKRTFLEIHRILRQDGIFVGIVPNFDSYLLEKLGDKWIWLTPEDHYSHFTPDFIARELAELGFVCELSSEEGHYGVDAIREFLSDDEIAEMNRQLRGSELIFICRKK